MNPSNDLPSPSRRTFIKSGIVLTAGLPFIQACNLFGSGSGESGDDLFAIFQNPPAENKPFVRWWWNGDKLSAAEILRELDVMKEAGIGGVEINPIAFPGGDDLGIPSLPWLSPEWIEMVKTALKGAEERGMICDTIVGSGWPFGAEFLTPEEQTQLLTLSSRKVKGPGKMTFKTADLIKEASPEVMSMYRGTTSELYSVCLAPVQMDTFSPAVNIPFEKGQNTVTVDIPQGEHILYALVKFIGFQAVINGAPGASGPVLNHYNQTAVEKFLNRMSDNLFPALSGLNGFRALFCDSMELEGANWCLDFAEEFERRKGYDIKPYLPFILYKVGHMGHAIEGAEITQLSGTAKEEVSRARYDFFVTCMDIASDRFLTPYTQWCNKYGFKSRVQAYGREFHPLDASFKIDIPECETWLWSNDGDKTRNFAKNPAYTPVNKFVASAARLSGKKEVSCEEITNTNAVFNATLERIKIVGDQSNMSGVTHSILHGFNYSPPETPFPGWVRYGTFFNERNTWWPYFKLWSTYKTRLSAVLRETDPFADIAVMHPLADMWTIHGPQRDPFPELRYPPYQYRVWEAIHQCGNACDYTSENIIQQSAPEKGFLKFGNRKYRTLILLETETMMPATAEALARFAASGGKVILVGKEPHKSPGLKNHVENDEKVKQIIASMKQQYPSAVFTVEAPTDDMIPWFKKVQQQCGIKPYMNIDNPSPFVTQIRQQAEGKDIFFISNCHTDERLIIRASFPESKGKSWLWNPETGERFRYPSVSKNTLTIDLPPAASQLIVFDTNGKGKDYLAGPPETEGMELKEWNLQMNHIDGTVERRFLPALKDLSADETTRSFAGNLYYERQVNDEINFSQEKENKNLPPLYNYLDLGKVYGVSEVMLNGIMLGCKWYGRHLYRIPESLAKAESKIFQIKITTTVGNYLKSSPNNDTGQIWTKGQDWQPTGMLGPVRLL